METVVGIFKSQENAIHAFDALRSAGVPPSQVSVLFPGGPPDLQMEAVPTSDTEQPGVGTAMGGVTGGALGIAGGLHLGTTIASIFVPGVGPVLAAGFAGAALLGAAGVAGGSAAGYALEQAATEGLPKDEVFLYEDALRQGRCVVIAFASDDRQAETLRGIIREEGAETVDAARHRWWLGLRDVEREKYAAPDADFDRDEQIYRTGFESALHPSVRGQSYHAAVTHLQARYPKIFKEEAFRRGFESGQFYYREFCKGDHLRAA